jgi:hypothetical protein
MTEGKITKGENSASISLTLELLNIVKQKAGKDEQINGFWICKRWLMFDEEVKKEIIEKYGQSFYDELLAHYSKTNLQQRAEREIKEEAKRIREEAKAKIEELKKPKKSNEQIRLEKELAQLEETDRGIEANKDENLAKHPEYREGYEKNKAERRTKIEQLKAEIEKCKVG